MIEINPLTPSYPIKKLDKIIQDDHQQQSKHNESSNGKKEDGEESTMDQPGHHIDEIV